MLVQPVNRLLPYHLNVIPAQAGIQLNTPAALADDIISKGVVLPTLLNKVSGCAGRMSYWMPAFAGMTKIYLRGVVYFRACGHDEIYFCGAVYFRACGHGKTYFRGGLHSGLDGMAGEDAAGEAMARPRRTRGFADKPFAL